MVLLGEAVPLALEMVLFKVLAGVDAVEQLGSICDEVATPADERFACDGGVDLEEGGGGSVTAPSSMMGGLSFKDDYGKRRDQARQKQTGRGSWPGEEGGLLFLLGLGLRCDVR